MAFALSSIGTRLLGDSFYSIAISPLKKGFTRKNIISLGSIPKKPLDLDLFLWPLVQELLQLEVGVKAFDALLWLIFILHAYLIVIFSDIPAFSLIMHMKGCNIISPCQMCEIQGIHKPGTKTHYVPLEHSFFPGSQDSYNPSALPLCNHASFLKQAEIVQSASTSKDFNTFFTKFGIKGMQLLSALSSLLFPTSFSYSFMHLEVSGLVWSSFWPVVATITTTTSWHVNKNSQLSTATAANQLQLVA
jgi:Transposase family tnp2